MTGIFNFPTSVTSEFALVGSVECHDIIPTVDVFKKLNNVSHRSLFLQFSQKMSTLSAASVESAAVTDGTEQKKPLKPCCACPETKKVRDAW